MMRELTSDELIEEVLDYVHPKMLKTNMTLEGLLVHHKGEDHVIGRFVFNRKEQTIRCFKASDRRKLAFELGIANKMEDDT